VERLLGRERKKARSEAIPLPTRERWWKKRKGSLGIRGERRVNFPRGKEGQRKNLSLFNSNGEERKKREAVSVNLGKYTDLFKKGGEIQKQSDPEGKNSRAAKKDAGKGALFCKTRRILTKRRKDVSRRQSSKSPSLPGGVP